MNTLLTPPEDFLPKSPFNIQNEVTNNYTSGTCPAPSVVMTSNTCAGRNTVPSSHLHHHNTRILVAPSASSELQLTYCPEQAHTSYYASSVPNDCEFKFSNDKKTNVVDKEHNQSVNNNINNRTADSCKNKIINDIYTKNDNTTFDFSSIYSVPLGPPTVTPDLERLATLIANKIISNTVESAVKSSGVISDLDSFDKNQKSSVLSLDKTVNETDISVELSLSEDISRDFLVSKKSFSDNEFISSLKSTENLKDNQRKYCDENSFQGLSNCSDLCDVKNNQLKTKSFDNDVGYSVLPKSSLKIDCQSGIKKNVSFNDNVELDKNIEKLDKMNSLDKLTKSEMEEKERRERFKRNLHKFCFGGDDKNFNESNSHLRKISVTSDLGDETDISPSPKCDKFFDRQYSSDSKTSDYEGCFTPISDAPRPIFPKVNSNEKALSSSITSSPDDAGLRKLSSSSGISSLSEVSGHKLQNSLGFTSVSDDWEWFPGRKRSVKRDNIRKISSVSFSSAHSSGFGSYCSDFDSSDPRKLSASSGVSCLSKINEESRCLSHKNLDNSNEDKYLNSTLDGKPLSLPSPVWPKSEIKKSDLRLSFDDIDRVIEEDIEFNIKSPSSCPLRRKSYEIPETSSSKESLDQKNDFKIPEKKDLETKKKVNRSRRRTLHVFENIADEWSKVVRKIPKHTDFSDISTSDEENSFPRKLSCNKYSKYNVNLDKGMTLSDENIDGYVNPKSSLTKNEMIDFSDDDVSVMGLYDSEETVGSTSFLSITDFESCEKDECSDTSLDSDSEYDLSFSSKSPEIGKYDIINIDKEHQEVIVSFSDINLSESEDKLYSANSSERASPAGVSLNNRVPHLKETYSLPNLSDIGEATVLDENEVDNNAIVLIKKNLQKSVDNITNVDEIVPYSKYNFSEVTFPDKVSTIKDKEEQEVIEIFSDEDIQTDADFENFSDSDHENEMDDINMSLFEPRDLLSRARNVSNSKSKRQKKFRQIKRKFSFNSLDKSKEIKANAVKSLKDNVEFAPKTLKEFKLPIAHSSKDVKESIAISSKEFKGTITSSLKRLKTAKQKIEKLVHKTLKTDSAEFSFNDAKIFSDDSMDGTLTLENSRSSNSQASTLKSCIGSQNHNFNLYGSNSPKVSKCIASGLAGCIDSRGSESPSSFEETSISSYNISSGPCVLEPSELRYRDGSESAYSWSDADSDFEYLMMQPPQSVSLECETTNLTENNEKWSLSLNSDTDRKASSYPKRNKKTSGSDLGEYLFFFIFMDQC